MINNQAIFDILHLADQSRAKLFLHTARHWDDKKAHWICRQKHASIEQRSPIFWIQVKSYGM